MKSRAFLLVALLASPAWSQQPAAEAATAVATPFDLRSDAVKKVVHDTAASQYSNAQVTHKAPVEGERREVEYVPPEEPLEELPLPAGAPLPSAPAPQPNGFVSSLFEFLLEEAIGVDEYDDVSSSNDMLRCRIQKEQKSSPPGPDQCPTAK